MSEPLREENEEVWIEDLNRFDEHIWPLFNGRGYSKGEAHLLYRLVGIQIELQDVNTKLAERTL